MSLDVLQVRVVSCRVCVCVCVCVCACGSVSLDIIGKAVFNYEFGSVTSQSPVIKAPHTHTRAHARTHAHTGSK